jgi:hypothetical protein
MRANRFFAVQRTQHSQNDSSSLKQILRFAQKDKDHLKNCRAAAPHWAMRRSRPIDPHQLVILNKRSEVKNLFVRCRQ